MDYNCKYGWVITLSPEKKIIYDTTWHGFQDTIYIILGLKTTSERVLNDILEKSQVLKENINLSQ